MRFNGPPPTGDHAQQTYQWFYEQYGPMAPKRELYRIAGALVLQQDVPRDQRMRLAVFQHAPEPLRPSIRSTDRDGRPYQRFNYSSNIFQIVTTDGADVHEWEISQVHGEHPGVIDHLNPYRQEAELLRFQMSHSQLGLAELAINRVLGEGYLRFNDDSMLWVLNSDISEQIWQQTFAARELPATSAELAS